MSSLHSSTTRQGKLEVECWAVKSAYMVHISKTCPISPFLSSVHSMGIPPVPHFRYPLLNQKFPALQYDVFNLLIGACMSNFRTRLMCAGYLRFGQTCSNDRDNKGSLELKLLPALGCSNPRSEKFWGLLALRLRNILHLLLICCS